MTDHTAQHVSWPIRAYRYLRAARDGTARRISFGVALTGLALFGYWAYCLVRPEAVWLRAVIGVLLLPVAGLWIYLRMRAHGARPTLRLSSVNTELERNRVIQDVIDSALTRTYSESAFGLLADMLAEPATYRERVVETFRLDRRSSRTAVRMTVCIDAAQLAAFDRTDRLLVPLIQPAKGRLYDDLSTVEFNGRSVRTLAHDEGVLVYVAVLLFLYRSTFGLPRNLRAWSAEHRFSMLNVVGIVLQSAAEVRRIAGRLGAPGADRGLAVQKLIAEIDDTFNEHQPVDADMGRRFLRAAHVGVNNYLVIVECPRVPSLHLGYEHTLPLETISRPGDRSESLWLTRILQRLLSMPSGYIRIALLRAGHSKSYHMNVEVPSGTYFLSGFVAQDEKPIEINPKPALATGVPYLRPVAMSDARAHVYARNLGPHGEQLTFESRICERPYGTELFAAVGSLSLLLLTLVFMRVAQRSVSDTDVTVAVLAFPATLAGMSVFFASALQRSVVVSIAGAGLTFISAGLAAAWMAAFAIEMTGSGVSDRHGGWHAFWIVALVVTSVVTLIAWAALVIRTMRYVQARPTRRVAA